MEKSGRKGLSAHEFDDAGSFQALLTPMRRNAVKQSVFKPRCHLRLMDPEVAAFLKYVRTSLGKAGEQDAVGAVVAYAEAVFYTTVMEIGTSEFNLGIAEKKIRKLALSEDRAQWAKIRAVELFQSYPIDTNGGGETSARKERKTQEPAEPVYVSVSSGYALSVKERPEVVRYAVTALEREPANARGLHWDEFKEYVVDLLEGSKIPVSDISALGIKPGNVRKKAEAMIRSWKAGHNVSYPPDKTAGVRTRMGTNPIAYEEGWQPRRN